MAQKIKQDNICHIYKRKSFKKMTNFGFEAHFVHV